LACGGDSPNHALSSTGQRRASLAYNSSKTNGAASSPIPTAPTKSEYIVRLVGQVIRVSIETVKIVAGLPKEFESAGSQAPA
jgi:hypothetical protein